MALADDPTHPPDSGPSRPDPDAPKIEGHNAEPERATQGATGETGETNELAPGRAASSPDVEARAIGVTVGETSASPVPSLGEQMLPVPASPSPTDERGELLTSPDTLCLNCGKALPGAYCPGCGQKAGPLRQPVHHFVRDAFLEFFGIDGRFWPTLWALLVKPGTLTREYVAGRRQTYLRPLRVYLVSTLSFFFLLSVIDPVGRSQETLLQSSDLSDSVRVADEMAEVDTLLAAGFDGLADERREVQEARRSVDSLAQSPLATEEAIQDARDALAEAVDDLAEDSVDVAGRLRRWEIQRAVLAVLPPDSLITADGVQGASRIIYPDTASFFGGSDEALIRSAALRGVAGAATETQRRENLVRFLRSAIGYVPTILFLILPIFALLLKVLYARREWYYSEHLIFGLHTHAFAFAVFSLLTLGILATTALDNGVLQAALGMVVLALPATIPIYFYVAQKRVYGQGWIKTAVKALILAFVYNTVLFFGLGAVFVIAAYFG